MKPIIVYNRVVLSTATRNNLLQFSTIQETAMATVNFSVPDDVEAFTTARAQGIGHIVRLQDYTE